MSKGIVWSVFTCLSLCVLDACSKDEPAPKPVASVAASTVTSTSSSTATTAATTHAPAAAEPIPIRLQWFARRSKEKPSDFEISLLVDGEAFTAGTIGGAAEGGATTCLRTTGDAPMKSTFSCGSSSDDRVFAAALVGGAIELSVNSAVDGGATNTSITRVKTGGNTFAVRRARVVADKAPSTCPAGTLLIDGTCARKCGAAGDCAAAERCETVSAVNGPGKLGPPLGTICQ